MVVLVLKIAFFFLNSFCLLQAAPGAGPGEHGAAATLRTLRGDGHGICSNTISELSRETSG